MDVLKKGRGPKGALEERLEGIREVRRRRIFRKRLNGVAGLALIILSPLIYRFFWLYDVPTGEFSALIPFVCGFLFLGYALSINMRELDDEIRNIFTELDILRIEEASAEERAEKLFLFHQFELKRYYDQTLRQSRWIFVVGVSCIAMGFVIIGFTGYLIYLFTVVTKVHHITSIIAAATGLLSAVLGDFIGYIYIRMYDGAVKSLAEFHERLVATHRIHFGNLLIEKMESGPLHEGTLARFALTLAEFKGVSDAEAKDVEGEQPEGTSVEA